MRARRLVALVVALAALGVMLSVVTGRRHPAPRIATSTTRITIGRSCRQETADWLDGLNRLDARARITAAYCAAADGRLVLVEMRSTDGRVVKWQAGEGLGALSRRLEAGE